jgi:hypothetical protein
MGVRVGVRVRDRDRAKEEIHGDGSKELNRLRRRKGE